MLSGLESDDDIGLGFVLKNNGLGTLDEIVFAIPRVYRNEMINETMPNAKRLTLNNLLGVGNRLNFVENLFNCVFCKMAFVAM
jgi:hypothetical protein